jgi:hypothetical protein
VRLTGYGQRAHGKPVSAAALCDLLRSHLGAEVPVSAGKTGIFMYAATADAAASAEGIARETLAHQGLAASTALEQWDASSQAWVLPGGASELPSGQQQSPGRRRLRTVGALIAAIIDASGRGA